MLRLTDQPDLGHQQISNLSYWSGGGTIISEGLMWAWRSLSPNAALCRRQGLWDRQQQKVIVLMTDGVNGLAENGSRRPERRPRIIRPMAIYGGWIASRATPDGRRDAGGAEPALRRDPAAGRGFDPNFDALATFFDSRLLTACVNAKAQGITIYTVMFNHNGFLYAAEQAHSLVAVAECATARAIPIWRRTPRALNAAFAGIGASVTSAKVHLKL